jgi:hypothetical protein
VTVVTVGLAVHDNILLCFLIQKEISPEASKYGISSSASKSIESSRKSSGLGVRTLCSIQEVALVAMLPASSSLGLVAEVLASKPGVAKLVMLKKIVINMKCV